MFNFGTTNPDAILTTQLVRLKLILNGNVGVGIRFVFKPDTNYI